jgi:hypothetical protein
MTLRDWFAGMFLQGSFEAIKGRDDVYVIFAAIAYRYADAMLAERSKKK